MNNINSSASLLLAASVKKIYPNVVLGTSNTTNEGFYYEFLFETVISDNDLNKIEKQIKRYISGGYKFIHSKSKIITNGKYREIISKENSNIEHYDLTNPANKSVEFSDFIIDLKIDKIDNPKCIKLLSLGGSYWKGDVKNQQFTRIYGIARNSQQEIDEHIKLLKERKLSDHRAIGKNMNLFSFNLLSGQGFPNWLEDGMYLKNTIKEYIKTMDRKYGFKEVSTSIVGDKKLYEISGHLDHYADTMFPVMNLNGEKLILRPMTCPHHILLYQAQPKTYNEFPIRYSEQSPLFRYEKSGALTGLERVRSMELTEGHVFVRKDQIKTEIAHCYKMIQETLNKFDIKIHSLVLSLRDPKNKEKYYDDNEMWEEAENDLRTAMNDLGIKYVEEIGEAAFYGPKIDIQVLSSMQKEITMSTLQLDFLLPKRFKIKYENKDKSISEPILLHRGLIGTYERFIAILLEQTKGNLPFWLAPKQINVIPVDNVKHIKYAQTVSEELKLNQFRVSVNETSDRLSKKIRDSQVNKNKFQIIIGDNEVSNNEITVREYGSKESKTLKLNVFITTLKKLA